MIWNSEDQNNEFDNPEQNPVRYDLLESWNISIRDQANNESSSTLKLVLMHVQNWVTSIATIVKIWNNSMRHRAKRLQKAREDTSDTSHIIIKGGQFVRQFQLDCMYKV